MAEGIRGSAVCTIAGLALFGHSPRSFLPQAGIRMMVFDGQDKQYRARLDEVLDYPMVGLWRQDGRGQRRLASADFGIVERMIEMLKPFISEEDAAVDSGFRRDRQWHYPREAVRELVINALAHRDWTRSVDIEIAVYSDRMEVVSPGALQNSMTIEKMLAGQRSPRNPLMVDVLRDYGYVDARGMGVRTKIVPLMRRDNRRDPLFELTDDYLRVTLLRRAD
jgi:ATP-dependent DNA helicase RecG